jgi:alanyl-tRNA synthetase
VGGEVVHVLDKDPTFKEGDVVKAKIDWQRRYRLMKMHTALHLLFSVCGKILGQNILVVGSNVGEEKSRVDIHLNGSINAELRTKIEDECNELIEKGAEVKIWWDPDKPNFRWTQIDEMVKIPCGGLHVKNIKEIGRMKIVKRGRIGKNKDRIEITVA